MNKQEIIDKVVELHQKLLENNTDKSSNDEIIELLEAVPEKERDDQLIGFLARAYNNDGRYVEAIKQLELVSEINRDDIWLYRMGYAVYNLAYEESHPIEMFKLANNYFSQIKQEDKDADEFMLVGELRIREAENDYQPLVANERKIYKPEQKDCIEVCSIIQQHLIARGINDLETATAFERDMILLYRLDSAMYNGGFIQFLYNWGYENFNQTGDFLVRLEAAQHLNLLASFSQKVKEVSELDSLNNFYDIAFYMKKEDELESKLNIAYWELEENLFERMFVLYHEEIGEYIDEYQL